MSESQEIQRDKDRTPPLHCYPTGFTSSVLVAEVREPPHVAQADDLSRHGQEELSLASPLAPGMQAIIFGGFYPVGEAPLVEQ